MLENSTDVRIKRVEQDIETLRTTQSALLDRYDVIYRTLVETREIAAENRSRLERVESRLKLVEEVVLENRAIMLENRDMIRENRAIMLQNREILLNIADHLDLTLETPPRDSGS